MDFYAPLNFCCMRDFATVAVSLLRNAVNILISACWHLDWAVYMVTLCDLDEFWGYIFVTPIAVVFFAVSSL